MPGFSGSVDRPRADSGDGVKLNADLKNTSSRPVAVRPEEIHRYLNWHTEPDSDPPLGRFGQVLGDDLVGAPALDPVVLRPGQHVSRSRKWILPSLPEGARVIVSVEYCNRVAGSVDGVSVLVGCVESNKAEFKIEP